jgi:hypothetical protein
LSASRLVAGPRQAQACLYDGGAREYIAAHLAMIDRLSHLARSVGDTR